MKNNSLRDVDPDKITAIAICLVALSYGGFLGFYYGVRYWDSGISGMVVGMLIGGFAFIVGRAILNLTAKAFSPLTGKRSAHWTSREQLEGDMNEARFYKRKEGYDSKVGSVSNQRN